MNKLAKKLSLNSRNLLPLWQVLSRNWIMKLVCLVMAFVVWQSVRESTSFEVVVSEVPVTVTAGEGLAVFDQSTDTVSIRFRGSREDIRFISSDQVEVKVELSGRNGRLRQTLKFSPRYVKAPSRAHAVQFDPPEITVTVDREVERVLPVKAVFEGELPQGIQMEKNLCTPATVKVRGAERLLSELEQVRTVPVSLDGRYNSFKTHVAVAASAQPWTVSPERVTVEASLVERVAVRRIENSIVRPLLASDDTRVVKIRPDKVAVTLRGSPQRIEELNPQDVYTYVDCTELTEPADYEVSVRVDLPAGLQIEKIEPAAVQVTVKKM
ncbi:MAG: CdaR family protein [Kiritimatiellales bacterium]|nr:CdaR family protein [Kiritimatiellales bacterium]